jgi:LCP family protein required for cell wall assembly
MRLNEEGPGREDGSEHLSGSGKGKQKREGKRSPKTRQQIVRRRIIVLASVCAALLILFALYKNWVRPPEFAPPGDPSQEEQTGENSEAPMMVTGRKEGWYTFLLCGVDDGNGGGDTIMVAAFDTKSQQLNVVSIPRDTLVNVAWSTKKINSAYNAGGIERLKEEVSKVMGFSVDFYVKVDLQGFVALVNSIGGVEFDVPFDMNYDDPTQDLHIHIDEGLQTLYGEDAIGVVRWRKNNNGTGYSSGDIGRIQTQQAFLSELAKQMLTIGNLTKVPEFAAIFSKYVETDLSMGNLVWLGQEAMNVETETIQFFTLPGNYTASYYNMKYGQYQSYVTLDMDEVIELVNTYFNPYTSPITAGMLDIMTINRDGSMSSSRGVLQDPSVAVPPTIPAPTESKETEAEPEQDTQAEPADPGETPADTGEPAGTEAPSGTDGTDTPADAGEDTDTDTTNTNGNTEPAPAEENPPETPAA